MPKLGVASLGRTIATHTFLDLGPPEATVLVAGMGRSGTTWIANIINCERRYRLMFEPFNPATVPEARIFGRSQYISADDPNPALAEAAARILSGLLRRKPVDHENRRLVYRRRLIKAVRCNLMLGWLRKLRPQMPVVFVVRHPLAVVRSWLRLGWERASRSPDTDFDSMLRQPALLAAHPPLAAAASQIDAENPLDVLVFLWGAFHYVPIHELPPGRFHCVFYENMVCDAAAEMSKLFAYLQTAPRPRSRMKAWRRASRTNFLDSRFGGAPQTAWRSEFSPAQQRRAFEILALFGLENVYPASCPPAAGQPSFNLPLTTNGAEAWQ